MQVYNRLSVVNKYASLSVASYVSSKVQKSTARQKYYVRFLNRFSSSNMCIATLLQGLGVCIIDSFANIDILTDTSVIDNLLSFLKALDIGEQLLAFNMKSKFFFKMSLNVYFYSSYYYY